MGRTAVKLERIENDASRRATFRKRCKGLLKKAAELSTLCDVETCVIVRGPDGTHPEVWPSEAGVRRTLARFQAVPEIGKGKKMMNQEECLGEQVRKLYGQFVKQQREIQDLEMNMLLLDGLAGRSLPDIGIEHAGMLMGLVEMKANEVRQRIDVLRSQRAAAAAAVAEEPVETKPMVMAIEAPPLRNWLVEDMNGDRVDQPAAFWNNGGGERGPN